MAEVPGKTQSQQATGTERAFVRGLLLAGGACALLIATELVLTLALGHGVIKSYVTHPAVAVMLFVAGAGAHKLVVERAGWLHGSWLAGVCLAVLIYPLQEWRDFRKTAKLLPLAGAEAAVCDASCSCEYGTYGSFGWIDLALPLLALALTAAASARLAPGGL